ncbi:MAG: hypothetical protein EBS85_01480 [Micrococcales bacterium]|nr:hypothetical protein [Micrococcales bacterium]
MELAFILIYGSLLGLMAPYLISGRESYGVLVAPALSLVFGFTAWTILTWAGLSYNDFWIWFITMMGMPVVMLFGVRFIKSRRLAQETQIN